MSSTPVPGMDSGFNGSLGYSSQEGQSTTRMLPYIERYFRAAMPGYADIFSRGAYGGSLTPGYDPFQEQAYGAGGQLYGTQFRDASSRFGGMGEMFAAGVPDATSYYRAALTGPQGFRPEDVNAMAYDPTLEASIEAAQRDIGQGFTEQVLPSIGRGFRAGGQSSGSTRRGIAEGLAGGRAAQAMGDVSRQLRGEAVSRGQQFAAQEVARRQAAAQHAGSALSGGAMDFFGAGLGFGERGVGGMMNLGESRRGIAGELMADDYRRFYEPMQFFERYMSTLSNPNFGRTTNTSSSGISAELGFGGGDS